MRGREGKRSRDRLRDETDRKRGKEKLRMNEDLIKKEELICTNMDTKQL